MKDIIIEYYVLEDVIAAQRDSHDGEIVDLQVFEDDSE